MFHLYVYSSSIEGRDTHTLTHTTHARAHTHITHTHTTHARAHTSHTHTHNTCALTHHTHTHRTQTECTNLTLVYGHGPSQFEWQLLPSGHSTPAYPHTPSLGAYHRLLGTHKPHHGEACSKRGPQCTMNEG